MISRNKGILSRNFLVPCLGLVFSTVFVVVLYSTIILPRAKEDMITGQLMATQASDKPYTPARSIYIVIKDPEAAIEFVLFIWGGIILAYKLWNVSQERKLLRHDFVRLNQGERIIPDDALDRYKDLRATVERTPSWRERLLPEFILAALHRFHSTHSVQDASGAVKDHAELAADSLDSDLSLVRYIAWAIPAVGFIGTVRGIGDALALADQAIKGDLSGITNALGLAFNTTLAALVFSIILMFVMHILQARQEGLVLELQVHCREKLIDVMKVPSQEESGVVI